MSTQDGYLNKSDARLSNFVANLIYPSQRTYQAIRRPSNIQIELWCLALIISAGLALISINKFQLGIYKDDAYYVVLARSLIQSNYFGLINLPGLPVPTQFPFGFPLLLSPFLLLFPGNLDVLKVLPFLATLLNGAILFWGWSWFNLGKSHWWGLAVSSLYLLSPLAQGNMRSVMSEPVFTTFCLVAILLGERAAREEENRWWIPFMSLALVFVLFTRTIGVVLIPVIFGYLLYVRGLRFWKQLAEILIGMAVIVGLVVAFTPVSLGNLLPTSYLSGQSATFIQGQVAAISSGQAADGLSSRYIESGNSQSGKPKIDLKKLFYDFFIDGSRQHYGEDIRLAVLPFGGGLNEQLLGNQLGISSLPVVLGYLVSILILIGYIRLFKGKKFSIFALFGVFYLAILQIWIWEGPRLLYPIQSQLQFGLLLGIEAVALALISRFKPKDSRKITNYLLAATIASLLIISVYKGLNVTDSRLYVGDLNERTAWLQAHGSQTDVLLTEAPAVDYLHSGLKTVPYPSGDFGAGNFEAYLSHFGVDYILVAPDISWQGSYVPSYSQTVSKFLPLFSQMIAQHKLAEVYSSFPDKVIVYQYTP